MMMNSTPLPPSFSIDTDYSIGSSRNHRRRRNSKNYNNNNNSPLHSIQSTLDNICSSLSDKLSQCNRQLLNNQLPPPHILLPSVISGTLAFYATSFSSQFVQYKLLKMSTGTRPTIIPISVGMATVAMGSWMGHLAGIGSAMAAVKYEEMGTTTTTASSSSRIGWRQQSGAPSLMEQCTSVLEEKILPMKDVAFRTIHEMTRPMITLSNASSNTYSNRRTTPHHERKEAWLHAARICIIGILTYKTIFRSNFMSLSPSSYTARGSFATKGIPIGSGGGTSSSFNYASKSQRDALHKIGTRFGCHTCGTRLLFDRTSSKFHGDHIPPISVAKQINNRWYNRILGRTVAQRFYPQCTSCSSKQGGLLSRGVNAGHKNLHSVGGGSESYFHGCRMRMGHLTGGLVAAVSTLGVVDDCREARWVMGSDEDEDEAALVVRSSRDRIRLIQYWVEDLIHDAGQTIRSVWSGKW